MPHGFRVGSWQIATGAIPMASFKFPFKLKMAQFRATAIPAKGPGEERRVHAAE